MSQQVDPFIKRFSLHKRISLDKDIQNPIKVILDSNKNLIYIFDMNGGGSWPPVVVPPNFTADMISFDCALEPPKQALLFIWLFD